MSELGAASALAGPDALAVPLQPGFVLSAAIISGNQQQNCLQEEKKVYLFTSSQNEVHYLSFPQPTTRGPLFIINEPCSNLSQ